MRAFLAAAFSLALAIPATAGVTIDEFKTDGGLTVWHVQEDSIPFVALELRFQGGASLDAEGLEKTKIFGFFIPGSNWAGTWLDGPPKYLIAFNIISKVKAVSIVLI